MNTLTIPVLNRRRTLAVLAGAGASALLGRVSQQRAAAQTTLTCVTAPAETEGPYFVEEMLNRSDIRVDPTDNSVRPGVPLTLSITVHQVTNTACGLLPGAHVEIWHCDALGAYSDEAANNTKGKKFLRGYQLTDANGAVSFTTIYPGWYSGRTVHIHFKIRTYSGSSVYDEFTSQFYLDDATSDLVLSQSPYVQHGSRDTRNSNDMVLTSTTNRDRLMLNLTKTDQGYAASADVGVNLKTPAAAKPVIGSSGVVNAASFESGVTPGAWISIFGQNFSAASQSLAASDLVNGTLPTALGGVSVQINGRPAFIAYVGPTQLNVQAPADSNTGAVQVTVSNAAGTSDPISANLQALLPGFFNFKNYVAAVRPDGTIITGSTSTGSGTTAAAKSGEALSLYGTGFGPTSPGVAPGAVLQTSAPLTNPVTITIGGVPAAVSFSGLSAAGLYQFNVTVPNLVDGDYEVVAQIAGLGTPAGVLLRVQGS